MHQTLEKPSEYEFTVSRSRFIGFAEKVQTEADLKGVIARLQDQHKTVRHICFAVRWISDSNVVSERFNDDGEPSGSAGKPILNHLQGSDLVNTGVFVLRYFGGIKLGVGGLVKAYGQAAKEALNLATIAPFVQMERFSLHFSYALKSSIDTFLKEEKVTLLQETFLENITLECEAPVGTVARSQEHLSRIGVQIKQTQSQ